MALGTKGGKKSKAKKQTKTTSLGGLRKLNSIAAVLHAVQGILVLVLSKPDAGIQAISGNYLTLDKLASDAQGRPVLAQASHHLFDLNLAYLVAAFFFMSAIAHAVVAVWYRKRYEENLGKGINKVRWIEYAFSASTMIAGVALLSGIFDIGALLALFGLTAVMNLLGLVMEVHNQGVKTVNWLSYWIGVIAGIVPWIVIALTLIFAGIYGEGGIPGFVYWIFGSIFVFFNLFAVNMILQYKKKGRWAEYLYGEKAYIVLSLVAKTALAWQVFGGTLRP